MSNEVIILVQLVFLYLGVVVVHKFFGRSGLYCFTVFATIAANIEVLLQVDAFGLSMAMGNIPFACTFLITDILSELYGKRFAQKCVFLGIFTSIIFTLTTVLWTHLKVNELDFAFPSFETIFSNTPRLMLTSLAVYFVAQLFDVWIYHKIWEVTDNKYGSSVKYLWVRNNGSTLVSQFINNVLYIVLAFIGTYSLSHIWEMILGCYVVYIFTSLLDTPIIYLVRRMYNNESGSNW